MNKTTLAAGLLLAGGIIMTAPEKADAMELPNYYVTTHNLNVRSHPSVEKGIYYFTIPAQELVEVIEYNSNRTWAYIIYNGTKGGWVCTKYLKVYEDDLNSTRKTTTRLNLREEPTTTKYNVIRTLPKGTKLIILKQKNNWLYVKPLDGIGYRGWVSAKYVR